MLLLAAAAVCVLAGGWLLAATWHLGYGTGLYCSLGTATTVGCNPALSAAGKVASVVVMLLAIPLLAACFSLATGAHVHKRVTASVAAAEQRITEAADKRHADLKQHISAAADGPVRGGPGSNPGSQGLPADGPVVPPPAAGDFGRPVRPDGTVIPETPQAAQRRADRIAGVGVTQVSRTLRRPGGVV